jgi:hypothetical protein
MEQHRNVKSGITSKFENWNNIEFQEGKTEI